MSYIYGFVCLSRDKMKWPDGEAQVPVLFIWYPCIMLLGDRPILKCWAQG